MSPFYSQKSGKESCSGLIHNHMILSDKSDKIREILEKKTNTLSWHRFLMRSLHDFSHFFWTFFVVRLTFWPSVNYLSLMQIWSVFKVCNGWIIFTFLLVLLELSICSNQSQRLYSLPYTGSLILREIRFESQNRIWLWKTCMRSMSEHIIIYR